MPQLADSMNCTGCAACANSCNHQAITMQPDVEGFLIPIVDGKKCIECKLCEKSCPVITVNECTNAVSPRLLRCGAIQIESFPVQVVLSPLLHG